LHIYPYKKVYIFHLNLGLSEIIFLFINFYIFGYSVATSIFGGSMTFTGSMTFATYSTFWVSAF